MPRYFTATVLLEEPWPLDIDRIARALVDRYPNIGKVDALPGQATGETGLLTIDHAQVVLQSISSPMTEEEARPQLRVLRTWDPDPAFAMHQAQITVTCGGRLPGVDGGKAFAAATHFVTTAVAGMVTPLAIHWGPAKQLVEPSDFAVSAETLLTGTMPLGAWIGYAPIVPEGAETKATGMVTYGLRPFIQHELELAPRTGDPRAAYRCVGAVVRRLMHEGLELRDGMRMEDPKAGLALTVRERRYWLRREESVFVLVAEDSIVDPWSLRPRDRNVA